MGFPQLSVSNGRNSIFKVHCQEALFNADGTKGNRSEWQGKEMKGYYDIFIADGEDRVFEPLWLRVFRYVKITIDTKKESLNVNRFHNIFTAYPLEHFGNTCEGTKYREISTSLKDNTTIHLPEELKGELIFKQSKFKLAGGENNFQLK